MPPLTPPLTLTYTQAPDPEEPDHLLALLQLQPLPLHHHRLRRTHFWLTVLSAGPGEVGDGWVGCLARCTISRAWPGG